MLRSIIGFLGVLAAYGAVHMEAGDHHPRDDFTIVGFPKPSQLHDVVFAVKQQNLDTLNDFLMDVSNPKSSNYGRYMNRDAIANLTANVAGTKAVVTYLLAQGVTNIKSGLHGEYIVAEAPVSTWESLFDTTFYLYKHIGFYKTIVRAKVYSLPEELASHVSAVFNTVQLPPRIRDVRAPSLKEHRAGAGSITPALLNSYYHITTNTGNALASQCLFESLGQYYSPADLSTFETNYNLPQDAVDEDIGGYVSDSECVDNANNCAEANLDVQYMMAVSQVTPTTYWYEDNQVDPFTAWIIDVANSENPPLVNSISYGSIEPEMPSSLANAFNIEAQKLGAMGVSILVSSGDDGVANFQARYNKRKCGYNPSFPATSPYVTAIGATQGPESGTTEIACASDTGGVITTGGGFSTVFDAPSYQTATIASYMSSLPSEQQPAAGYAVNGRGYPDIAMAGLNYEVVIGGKTYEVSGTSASSPVVAGMVSLVNAARMEAGKPPLGFLNTALYQSGTSVTNDVTSGENNCTAGGVCCDEGFYAAAGWDPLTGFGSLDYEKFYNVFFNL